jgi:hypothetical protein
MTESADTIAEPLRSILQGYFNVEMFWHSFPKDLLAYLAQDAELAARFKAQFAAAIVEGTLSAAQYQKLTDQSFDNEGALYAWLYKLWAEIYGEEPVPGDD